MGLDIYAARGITRLNPPTEGADLPTDPATDDEVEDYFRAFNLDSFRARSEGLDDGAYYRAGEEINVLSTGYGAYNHWREELAKLAGYTPTPHTSYGHTQYLHAAACWNGETGPFHELINFADNEGTLGPAVLQRLAKDFADFEERARAIGDRFYKHFTEIRHGLEFAGADGCFRFS